VVEAGPAGQRQGDLEMSFILKSLRDGPETHRIWDSIWSSDPYSRRTERRLRARQRIRDITNHGASFLLGPMCLDAGCGSGDLVNELASRDSGVTEFFGFDFSSAAINLARKVDSAIPIKLLCADGRRIPFKDNTFSSILSFGVIEHIKEPHLYLRELHRVAARGARIYLTASSTKSTLYLKNLIIKNIFDYNYGYQNNYKPKELAEIFAQHFISTQVFVSQTDKDMRCINFLDELISYAIPNWGRYIYLIGEKA